MLEPPLTSFALTPTPLTQPYWDAARNHKLIVQQCSACERKFFRPELRCPHCRNSDWRWVDSDGRGALYSFSVLHRAPSPAFKAPFIFAAVEMNEGWTCFSNLIGLELDAARIGMALEVCFHDLSPTLTIPLFQPARA